MDQFERLEDIFKNNNNKGMAVAITGQWGIGKTFFWNKFINERAKREEERKYLPFFITQKYPNLFNKKYAYISLFGVESLADLKTAICTNLSSNHFNESSSKNIETPIRLKKFISQFRDIKISQYGVSTSARLIESFFFTQVSNAIICFDDFERMSNKLDIKDVMGLANQLKLERNCQVILILDESKTLGENKDKYSEYKEKLIDEEIKINSVEPLIRENSKDFDHELVELMINFAIKVEIHNFRFFKKVITLYKNFIDKLLDNIAYSTKEVILIRILQGYLIKDYSKLEYGWGDCKYFTESKKEDWSDTKKTTYENLKKVSYSFVNDDLWLNEFRKWFDQDGDFDLEGLHKLSNSNLINEENNAIKNEFSMLCYQIWNYQCDESFPKKFFETSIRNIGLQNLGNLDFAITILEKFDALDESKKLEQKVKHWINKKLEQDRKSFRGINAFGQGEHRFSDYIENFLLMSPTVGLPSISDSMYAYYINQQYSYEHKAVLEQITKENLKQFIEIDFFKDERFAYGTVASLVQKFSGNLKSLVIEILEDRREKSDFQSKYVDYLISRLES